MTETSIKIGETYSETVNTPAQQRYLRYKSEEKLYIELRLGI